MTDTYGFKVSKPGEDVNTASGADLVLDIDSTVLKVFASGTLQKKYSDGTIAIAHNLGYIPHFLVYGNGGSGDPHYYLGTGKKPLFEVPVILAWADTSNVYFYVGSATNVSIYYYIFYDKA